MMFLIIFNVFFLSSNNAKCYFSSGVSQYNLYKTFQNIQYNHGWGYVPLEHHMANVITCLLVNIHTETGTLNNDNEILFINICEIKT